MKTRTRRGIAAFISVALAAAPLAAKEDDSGANLVSAVAGAKAGAEVCASAGPIVAGGCAIVGAVIGEKLSVNVDRAADKIGDEAKRAAKRAEEEAKRAAKKAEEEAKRAAKKIRRCFGLC